MSNLEDLIRDLVAHGELTHLSLVPRALTDVDDKPTGKKGWAATVAPASSMGNTFAVDADPIKALIEAIEGVRLRRRAPFQDGEGAKVKPPKVQKPRKEEPQVDLSDLGL